jgi:hypothetical protein
MSSEESVAVGLASNLTQAVPSSLDESLIFRLAQLLLLLEVARATQTRIDSVDRLAFSDFFAANPYLVLGSEERDQNDRRQLQLAGFSDRQLSYAAAGERFISRRQRLQHDLALLLAHGLLSLHEGHYNATGDGLELASHLDTVYADAYRTSAEIVFRRLKPLGAGALRRTSEAWLGKSWLLIDLLDDVREVTINAEGPTT